MIATIRAESPQDQQEFVHERFLTMLPQIQRQARLAFRDCGAEARQEMTQDVVAAAFCMFVRLYQRGNEAEAYPTPLAEFAIRRVRSGRSVGCQMNVNDVLSTHCCLTQGLMIERLDQRQSDSWNQQLVESRHAGPAETAAARIDVADWFQTLSPRDRKIAKSLASGERTCAVAKKFGLTAGRVSQLRAWFRSAWEQFQGGDQLAGCAL
jgi:hypothetical protein